MIDHPHIITFDCYGTLIDWESGIYEAFAATYPEAESLGRTRLIATYAAVEPEVEAGPYLPYRDVLRLSAVAVARRLGLAEPADGGEFLASSLPGWRPFADTIGALTRLTGHGIELGILSNVDDDLLAGTLRHLPLPWSLLVTAQQVRSYKPARGHFDAAARRIGETPWLHAAQSWFHDVVPARRLGVPVAWINRKAEAARASAEPDGEFPDLAALVDRLGAG